MDFKSFLTEETITEKELDNKIERFKAIAKDFYAPDLIKFIKTFSEREGAEHLLKAHWQMHEDLLDFIYELDSTGVSLNKTGKR